MQKTRRDSLHGISQAECFHAIEILDVFHLDDPLRNALGQAICGNYLVFFQGVPFGGVMKLSYPSLGEGSALLVMSFLISESVICSNRGINAGVQVYGGIVSDNSYMSLRDGIGHVTTGISWSIKGCFFK